MQLLKRSHATVRNLSHLERPVFTGNCTRTPSASLIANFVVVGRVDGEDVLALVPLPELIDIEQISSLATALTWN